MPAHSVAFTDDLKPMAAATDVVAYVHAPGTRLRDRWTAKGRTYDVNVYGRLRDDPSPRGA